MSVPRLDRAVDAALEAGAHGARMTGGGFGGSVVVLIDEAGVDDLVQTLRASFARHRFDAPSHFLAIASDGAGRVR